MAPDGTGVHRWITSAANDTAPAWSPDHTRVAFVSDRNGASHVFVAGSEGRQPKDLTPGTAVCGAPAWSPDGTQLAFVRWETTGAQANIRIMTSTAKKLGLPMKKMIVTVDQHGNTSAASIPLALDKAMRDGRIKPGQNVMMEGVGGGFTWGAVLARM